MSNPLELALVEGQSRDGRREPLAKESAPSRCASRRQGSQQKAAPALRSRLLLLGHSSFGLQNANVYAAGKLQSEEQQQKQQRAPRTNHHPSAVPPRRPSPRVNLFGSKLKFSNMCLDWIFDEVGGHISASGGFCFHSSRIHSDLLSFGKRNLIFDSFKKTI